MLLDAVQYLVSRLRKSSLSDRAGARLPLPDYAATSTILHACPPLRETPSGQGDGFPRLAACPFNGCVAPLLTGLRRACRVLTDIIPVRLSPDLEPKRGLGEVRRNNPVQQVTRRGRCKAEIRDARSDHGSGGASPSPQRQASSSWEGPRRVRAGYRADVSSRRLGIGVYAVTVIPKWLAAAKDSRRLRGH